MKIYAINQYMVDNVTYDFSNRGLWDAFYIKRGLWYFRTLYRIASWKAGIESVYIIGYAQVDGRGDIDEYEIMGYSNNSHAWNLVKLNGKYYHWIPPRIEDWLTKMPAYRFHMTISFYQTNKYNWIMHGGMHIILRQIHFVTVK